MTIDFPNSPSTNDTYTYAGKSWYYNGTAWQISAANFGHEHTATVTGNYTLSNGRNLISGGPITVNSGVVVTVESGANWTVV